jgi:nodulation protein E
MGAVSACGIGVEALWSAVRDGRSCVRELSFALPYRGGIRHAADVIDFEPSKHIDSKSLLFCDLVTSYLIVAADEAMSAAGLTRDSALGASAATIVGTGIGGVRSLENEMYELFVKGKLPDALIIPRCIASSGPAMLSMRYGARGPCFSVSSACASASQAIGLASQMIRSGLIDRAVVGGAEECLSSGPIVGWEALRVLTKSKCRPFSKDRDGMVLGAGAGVLVLENAELALKRGAPILAELAGYGTSSDAKDPIRPDPRGASKAIENALRDAEIGPDRIDYINAHGTGTVVNDAAETAALHEVFCGKLPRIAVSSTKPVHGHCLGACGAIELIVTIKSIQESVAPPTINWTAPDPNCTIDVVPNEARPLAIRTAMSNSFAFGGINAALIVREFPS